MNLQKQNITNVLFAKPKIINNRWSLKMEYFPILLLNWRPTPEGVIYACITVQAYLHYSYITATLRLHYGYILELRMHYLHFSAAKF
jgi:hypothetical protein